VLGIGESQNEKKKGGWPKAAFERLFNLGLEVAEKYKIVGVLNLK
jgi:hypothetical protein